MPAAATRILATACPYIGTAFLFMFLQDILWMDEIHFAPPKKPWNGLIPCKYVSHGFLGGAGFRLSTVSLPAGMLKITQRGLGTFMSSFWFTQGHRRAGK